MLISDDVTVEDIARALAWQDGKAEKFCYEKEMKTAPSGIWIDERKGYYEGYMIKAAELLKRANKYASERKDGTEKV